MNTSSLLIAEAFSLGISSEALRRLMACSEAEFEAYRTGREEPPTPKLDRLVDFMVAEEVKIIRTQREFDETRQPAEERPEAVTP